MADIKIERQIMAKFKPQARLLSQLGDQLIKNESIALIELVKNAYDADANKVSISIDNVDSENDSTITIKDDGIGMPLNIVQNVWLEPGSNHKAKLIAESQKTKKYHRLPIGEKGIGRFGVHKLGNVIEMTTKSENSKEVFIRIDWTEFSEHRYLDDVPITIIERETPEVFCNNTTGTLIIISKLKKKWERGIARNAQRAITSLASPFDGHESFIPTFSIKEKPGWFDGLLKWDDIKEYALFQFNITMEGGYITDFIYKFTPWLTMSKLIPREIDKNDPLVNNYLRLSSYTDKVQSFIDLTNHKIGKIIFKGYVFDQDNFLLKMGVSDKKGFQRFMKDNGGVRVYRDNLRVYDYGEKENDWLSLDHRRFQQPTKAISNNLILGSVYIDREDSSDLEEKTNREGFVDNDAYQAFKSAILHSVELIEILRQSDKKRLKEIYGPTPKSEPVMSILGEAQRYVDEKVVDLDVKKEIKKYLTKIEKDYKNVTENLLKAAGAGLSMSVVVHEVEKIRYEVEKFLKAENASDRVLSLVKHLSSLIVGYAEIIRR